MRKALIGVTESDTGLTAPNLWDLEGDKHLMSAEHALHVARCTKIIDPGTDAAKYLISMRDVAKRPGVGPLRRSGAPSRVLA